MAGIEQELVAWLQQRQRPNSAIQLGIGDDMALLETPSNRILLSSDMLLDGVHFESKTQSLALIGRKSLACSLSDCAAMAVRPIAAVVSLALPAHWTLAQAQELMEGVFALAADFDVQVVGGDTTSWENPLVVDVAVTATPYEGVEPVRRNRAREGDILYVTGPLGGSLLGRHLTFVPRVHEARSCAQSLGCRLHAMMDISDGLSLDIWRMCTASHVGAELDESLLAPVISEDARRMSAMDGRTALDHVLGDGEDFELLCSVDSDTPSEISAIQAGGTRLLPIGRVTHEGLQLRRLDGRIEKLEPRGFTH